MVHPDNHVSCTDDDDNPSFDSHVHPQHCAYSSCTHDKAPAPFPLCLLHVVLSLSHNPLLSRCVGC